MPMMNRDLINKASTKYFEDLSAALKNGDSEAAGKALQEMQNSICEMIEKEFEQYHGISDVAVLQSRGLRALTSEETAWYQEFIGAVKTGAKQAITNLTTAMPATIIDRVIEDMQHGHPLLNEINILNAAGATKLVKNAVQMASKMGTWGAVTAAITQQLTGEIEVVDLTTAKYTAYFLIPKDFVKFNFSFAPMWVDQYIRIILSESVAYGLEDAIVAGNGNNKFVGMTMDTTTISNNAYTAKTAVALADFEDAYANVVAGLAVDGNGDARVIPEVLLVVNPVDYIKKVRRAQNAIVPGVGVVDLISNTYPTKVVTSVKMPQNKAVAGIAKNYFCAINGGTSGIIEYSDEYQFLEDNRVYTTRVYGQGMPVDNTSFTYLDITNVEAPALPVKVKGTVKTKEQN